MNLLLILQQILQVPILYSLSSSHSNYCIFLSVLAIKITEQVNVNAFLAVHHGVDLQKRVQHSHGLVQPKARTKCLKARNSCNRTFSTILFNNYNNDNYYLDDEQSRRSFLEWTVKLSSPLLVATDNENGTSNNDNNKDKDTSSPSTYYNESSNNSHAPPPHDDNHRAAEEVTIPLRWISSLNAYVLYFGLFDYEPEKFGAILDTGSPFLTVPSYCNRSKWGCYRPELTTDSGYSNTIERFDNNEGTVVWRKSRFSFVDASGSLMGLNKDGNAVFGVLDEQLMGGSGGVFFGLIRDTEKWIRPSLLGQLGVTSFKIDLKDKSRYDDEYSEEEGKFKDKSLTLATKPMIRGLGYIPLVTDLNRKYKDPVGHYTTIADKIMVNGNLLQPTKFKNKPTYVIFDTGVTGMVVSQELFEDRYTMSRLNREKSLWPSVEISFLTKEGKSVTLRALKPITTPLAEKPWPGFNANLIVMGLAFLDNHTITIDIDDRKLQID